MTYPIPGFQYHINDPSRLLLHFYVPFTYLGIPFFGDLTRAYLYYESIQYGFSRAYLETYNFAVDIIIPSGIFVPSPDYHQFMLRWGRGYIYPLLKLELLTKSPYRRKLID